MTRIVSAAVPAVAFIAFAAYAIAAHLVFATAQGTRLAGLFVWAPLALTALWLLWDSAYRRAAAAVFAVVTAALWFLWPDRGADITMLYLGQYVALHAGLGALFGRTLLGEREPLVTRLARLVHGELPPPISRYTRAVTAAWTLFFGAMAAGSVLLYVFAPRVTWSAFVNLLTLPCVVAMFLVEYAVRRLLFPWYRHVSIFVGVRAFWRSLDRTQS